jgi:hypothetical protein
MARGKPLNGDDVNMKMILKIKAEIKKRTS